MKSDSATGPANVPELIQTLSDEFDAFSQSRHLVGQEKYGEFTFLENDMWQMMMEELADMANYARYQFIKLRMLQMVEQKLLPEEELPGIAGFHKLGDKED